jgi:hypothetical protein
MNLDEKERVRHTTGRLPLLLTEAEQHACNHHENNINGHIPVVTNILTRTLIYTHEFL